MVFYFSVMRKSTKGKGLVWFKDQKFWGLIKVSQSSRVCKTVIGNFTRTSSYERVSTSCWEVQQFSVKTLSQKKIRFSTEQNFSWRVSVFLELFLFLAKKPKILFTENQFSVFGQIFLITKYQTLPVFRVLMKTQSFLWKKNSLQFYLCCTRNIAGKDSFLDIFELPLTDLSKIKIHIDEEIG